MKSSRFSWLDYIAVFIIVIAFFLISNNGFLREDDWMMNHGVSSISDVFHYTKLFYLTMGGRWFSVASQYLFAGVLGNQKIWFDIVNTLFFLLLIVVCGALIHKCHNNSIRLVLVFTLFFWFLCPNPKESVFWIAGTTTYLWANSLVFLFLLVFLKYKDLNFGVSGKVGLFLLSFISATEFISCAAVCGAFVVYYAFHLKEFRNNVLPLVGGFVIGSIVVLLAPGNFARVAWEETSLLSKISDLVHHPLLEIVKYKSLWLFLIVLVYGWIKNKNAVRIWMKNNSILLISLGWSVIAFSCVFRPLNRALFFPETLSLVLFLKFLYDNYHEFRLRFLDELFKSEGSKVQSICIILMFVAFIVDSANAISEAKQQRINNDVLLSQINESGGVVALDRMVTSHRMAYVAGFPEWTWDPLADRFGLDSVHVYPHYCQDKFYHQDPPLENAFIEDNYAEDDIFGRLSCLTVRVKEDDLEMMGHHVLFQISYSRPHKWYKLWLDKLRNYQYDRVAVFDRDKPNACFDSYCYYVFWMKKEDLNNLNAIKVEHLQDSN